MDYLRYAVGLTGLEKEAHDHKMDAAKQRIQIDKLLERVQKLEEANRALETTNRHLEVRITNEKCVSSMLLAASIREVKALAIKD